MNTIEKAIEQIKMDISSGDVSAIYELLENVPEQALKAFLPEYGALWENEYQNTDDDTYDEWGVNTKNSFNTPPKGQPC